MLLRTAQSTKNCFGSRSTENARFFAFAILRMSQTAKKAFTLAEKSITVVIIDIDALKI